MTHTVPQAGLGKCRCCGGSRLVKVPTRFGPRCQYERLARGLTLRALEDAIGGGINNTTIHRVEHEKGRPSVQAALLLCKFYGLKLDDYPDLLEARP